MRLPAQAATDPRITVTLNEPGTPWPIRFHFLRLDDEGSGVREIVNTGFEIGHILEMEWDQHEMALTDEQALPIDAAALQRIVQNYATYLEGARLAIRLEWTQASETVARARGPVGRGRRLTDDDYRLIAADWQAHQQSGGTQKTFAAKHFTGTPNVSKWLAEARRRGYLPEKAKKS